MDILPARIEPFCHLIRRVHAPTPLSSEGGYRAHRPCLRWEFGFTCAACLLHESDFTEYGTEGTGLMTIEHLEPRSADPARANDYDNCIYLCRFCNGERSDKPVVNKDGDHLLNPTEVVWADHFEVDGDEYTDNHTHCGLS